uniref:F-box domain-containing protein n=1 Tax=Oryza brachyantha TaxID=4533 RepID=J3LPB3_ORYBR
MATHDDGDNYAELLCDDVLELIFLRLDSPVTLVRAPSACKRWCSAAADAIFLRRFRSLHRPIVLGHYSTGHPASFESYVSEDEKPVPFFLPSPSLAAISAGSHLAPDFLGSYSEILDSCGSLLLLRPRRFTFEGILYEPLTRRRRVIDDPPEPWDWKSEHYRGGGAYLLG